MTSYQPIRRWPSDYLNLGSSELPGLTALWRERRAALEADGRLGPFIERLNREWAIETGLIERLYVWDRGVTEMLIAQGIDAATLRGAGVERGEAARATRLIRDHERVIEGLFGFVKGESGLSEHFIRATHQELTLHQPTCEGRDEQGHLVEIPLLRGAYETRPNNPRRADGTTHEYCPPERVVDEMQSLITMYRDAPADLPVEVLSAWLHHRFTQIHPFQDGNGRVARTLGSLVFMRAGLLPLVMRNQDRVAYIDALEQADAGELQPLAALFARRQKDALLGALSVAARTQRPDSKQALLASLRNTFERKADALQQAGVLALQERGLQLQKTLSERLHRLADELDSQLRGFRTADGKATQFIRLEPEFDGTFQAETIARELGYRATFDRYHGRDGLSLRTDRYFLFGVDLHTVGDDNNLVAAVAWTDDLDNPAPACLEPFQTSVSEDAEVASARFELWFAECEMIALAEWQRSLA